MKRFLKEYTHKFTHLYVYIKSCEITRILRNRYCWSYYYYYYLFSQFWRLNALSIVPQQENGKANIKCKFPKSKVYFLLSNHYNIVQKAKK